MKSRKRHYTILYGYTNTFNMQNSMRNQPHMRERMVDCKQVTSVYSISVTISFVRVDPILFDDFVYLRHLQPVISHNGSEIKQTETLLLE